MQIALHDVMVRLERGAAWSETTVTSAGPWALTLITVVPWPVGARLGRSRR